VTIVKEPSQVEALPVEPAGFGEVALVVGHDPQVTHRLCQTTLVSSHVAMAERLFEKRLLLLDIPPIRRQESEIVEEPGVQAVLVFREQCQRLAEEALCLCWVPLNSREETQLIEGLGDAVRFAQLLSDGQALLEVRPCERGFALVLGEHARAEERPGARGRGAFLVRQGQYLRQPLPTLCPIAPHRPEAPDRGRQA
jgi:hypothetical protein